MQNCWSFPCCLSQIVANLSVFCRYYFGRYLSEQAQLVPLPYSWGRSTHYSDRLHNFSTIPWCYKDDYVSSFFPHTARLWNFLPVKCFALTYDLNVGTTILATIYTFREWSFMLKKKFRELRNELLQMFGKTSWNKLSILPKNLNIICLNKKIFVFQFYKSQTFLKIQFQIENKRTWYNYWKHLQVLKISQLIILCR